MSRNKNVSENTIAYFGVQGRFPSYLRIGSKFYIREFLPTSLKRELVENWISSFENKMLFIIKITNNGSNGYSNYCYYIEDITYTKSQYQVLISCLCCFKVTKIEEKDKMDIVYLTCEGNYLN